MNGNVTQIYRHMNELRTDTCEQETHPASPSMTLGQLRPDTGPLTHRASKVRNSRRYEDFLVPPGDSIPRSSQRSESGVSALPEGSTWLVAGFNGLKRQLRISSSKPVELGHDERDGRCKKKCRETGKDGGILLVVISCCAPPSVALRWPAVRHGRGKRGKIAFSSVPGNYVI